jgi:hypothetical protein
MTLRAWISWFFVHVMPNVGAAFVAECDVSVVIVTSLFYLFFPFYFCDHSF